MNLKQILLNFLPKKLFKTLPKDTCELYGAYLALTWVVVGSLGLIIEFGNLSKIFLVPEIGTNGIHFVSIYKSSYFMDFGSWVKGILVLLFCFMAWCLFLFFLDQVFNFLFRKPKINKLTVLLKQKFCQKI